MESICMYTLQWNVNGMYAPADNFTYRFTGTHMRACTQRYKYINIYKEYVAEVTGPRLRARFSCLFIYFFYTN